MAGTSLLALIDDIVRLSAGDMIRSGLADLSIGSAGREP